MRSKPERRCRRCQRFRGRPTRRAARRRGKGTGRAKSKAAAQGVPLRPFVTEAVEDKLKSSPTSGRKPWMKHVGKLKDLRKETQRINRVIEKAFEVVDSEIRGAG